MINNLPFLFSNGSVVPFSLPNEFSTLEILGKHNTALNGCIDKLNAIDETLVGNIATIEQNYATRLNEIDNLTATEKIARETAITAEQLARNTDIETEQMTRAMDIQTVKAEIETTLGKITELCSITEIPLTAVSITFPEGEIFEVSSPIIIPSSVKYINGNNALIRYSKEQTLNNISESCITINGNSDLIIEKLRIEYTGTFQLAGTYDGKISGIRVLNSNRVKVINCEISKFNYTGLLISAEENSTYCENVIVEKCYLHHNRVAGIYFGNTEKFVVEECLINYNGVEGDSTTGYGIAGMSTHYPKNTLIFNNDVSNNVRKGIDFHSGYNSSIIANKVVANGIYGIFHETINRLGKCVIKNNVISGMIIDGTKTGFTVGYCIWFGSAYAETTNIRTFFDVSDNYIVANDVVNGGQIFPLNAELDNLFNCTATIKNNTIVGNNATAAFSYKTRANIVPCTNVIFENNYVDIAEYLGYPIYINSTKTQLISIQNNTFKGHCLYGNILFISASTLSNHVRKFNGNVISMTLDGALGEYGMPFTLVISSSIVQTAKENVLNGVKLKDYDGTKFVSMQTSVPADSYKWSQGSIVYNSLVASTGTYAWICTNNVAPATWRALA